jgi:hypothetical protein
MQSQNLNELVVKYLEIRSKRESLQRDYEEIDGHFKKQLSEVELELLAACNTINANSINTEHGTVMRKLNERFYCTDWDNFKKFVLENGAVDLFERRIHQTNFKQYMADSGEKDGLPPGVNVMREFGVVVRKPSNK